MTIAVECLTCDGLVEIESARVGQEVECVQCGEAFFVARTEPLVLGYAYDLEEEGEFFDEDRPRT